MQQHNMSWIEVQFLKKAVDVLCQCRQMLMFTYVFAFYLKKNNQSIIFEVRDMYSWILFDIVLKSVCVESRIWQMVLYLAQAVKKISK